MRRARAAVFMLGVVITIIMIVASISKAEQVPSLLEYIEKTLQADPGLTADERAMYIDSFRTKLAAYGRDVLKGGRQQGADVLMTIVMEGSFDQAPIKRTVDIASEAYIAVRRGSDPDAVEGIALYGFRKQVDADRIETWANGYGTLRKSGVPSHVAEDLVFQAAEHDWDIYTFNTFKWALVEAAKAGYDPEDFQAYVVGNFLAGDERPGRMVSRAKRYFRSLGGAEPELPAYKGSFIPRRKPQVPPPSLDLTKQEEPGPGPLKEQTDGEEAPGIRPPKDEPAQGVPPAPQDGKAGQGPSSPGPALGYMLRIEDSYQRYLGVPYAWGGTTMQGMDCSGFVQRVYAEAGIRLPRSSRGQWGVGTPVARYAIRQGDLVFFRTAGDRISHVGIVTRPAEDEFVHASSSKGVSFALLSWQYFDKRYAGARRIVPEGLAGPGDLGIYRVSRIFVYPALDGPRGN